MADGPKAVERFASIIFYVSGAAFAQIKVSQVHRCKPTMKTRSITHLRCPCGHRGSIIESVDDEAAPDGWHFSCLRDLKHGGDYEGLDPLFADTLPACPVCGQSLGPEHVVERGELTAAMPD